MNVRITVLLLLTLPAPFPAAAGAPLELPTLADLGAGWSSDGGALQLRFSGRLALEGLWPGESPPWIIPETEDFLNYKASLFSDLFLGDHLLASLELRGDRGEAPEKGRVSGRVEQAWVRWTPWAGRNFHLQAGRFVHPFGAWPQRHDTWGDFFIRPPLPYEWRTMVCPGLAPRTNDGFIAWKYDPDRFRPSGAPPVWGAPYNQGLQASGGAGFLTWRLAWLNSAPSSEPFEWNRDFGEPSIAGHVGFQISPAFRFGFSYHRGPYMLHHSGTGSGSPVTDWDSSEYDQILVGVDAEFSFDRTMLRAEAFHDTWQVPNVLDDPVDVSWYLEARQRFGTGFSLAVRYGTIGFNALRRTRGEPEPWDWDTRRTEVSAGWRLGRNAELRAQAAWTRSEGPEDPDDDLVALQWRWFF
jgi:hypothetical protein